MRKTSLLIVPVLAALVLAGCTTAKKGSKKKKSSSGEVVSTSGKSATSKTSGGGISTTSTTGGTSATSTTPTPTGGKFDLTPGRHEVELDFEADIDKYVDGIPRAEQGDTAPKEGNFEGMKWNMFHTYRGSYTDEQTGALSVWLMMKDKDNWDATSNAFFGNNVSLGSIESITVTIRSGASTKKKYDLSVGDSAFTTAQTGGTEFDVSTAGGGQYTGSGKGFFVISTKKDTGNYKYNGQIAKLAVTYTIS